MTWSSATVLYVPGLGLCSGAPVSHMSEQVCGSALGPLGWYKPPMKLSFSRKGSRGWVDFPKENSAPCPAVGNQLHSSMPFCDLGSDIPLAV